jgi:hypothetical protein
MADECGEVPERRCAGTNVDFTISSLTSHDVVSDENL